MRVYCDSTTVISTCTLGIFSSLARMRDTLTMPVLGEVPRLVHVCDHPCDLVSQFLPRSLVDCLACVISLLSLVKQSQCTIAHSLMISCQQSMSFRPFYTFFFFSRRCPTRRCWYLTLCPCHRHGISHDSIPPVVGGTTLYKVVPFLAWASVVCEVILCIVNLYCKDR